MTRAQPAPPPAAPPRRRLAHPAAARGVARQACRAAPPAVSAGGGGVARASSVGCAAAPPPQPHPIPPMAQPRPRALPRVDSGRPSLGSTPPSALGGTCGCEARSSLQPRGSSGRGSPDGAAPARAPAPPSPRQAAARHRRRRHLQLQLHLHLHPRLHPRRRRRRRGATGRAGSQGGPCAPRSLAACLARRSVPGCWARWVPQAQRRRRRPRPPPCRAQAPHATAPTQASRCSPPCRAQGGPGPRAGSPESSPPA
eukprot:scaffold86530_cov48-Phaeocystis_antarctica.AAC.1